MQSISTFIFESANLASTVVRAGLALPKNCEILAVAKEDRALHHVRHGSAASFENFLDVDQH
jgi:hypothetical protein